MTTEEKAKAYDEALKKAKKYHEEYWQVDAKDITETLFPELRESEDDRVRKSLINFLSSFELMRDDATFRKGDFDLDAIKGYISYLEKQKEATCVAEIIDRLTEKEQELLFKELDMQKEQNHAEWSEEDEKHINIILRVLDRQQCWDGATWKKFNPYQGEIDWLKSLRPQPQKLEDWTEEDERLLGDVLGCITLVQTYKACGDLKDFKMEYTGEALRSFVRSLKSRPRKQPHWKPSEEQMNYLCAAVDAAIRKHNESVSGYEPARVLKSLYEDLKKL